MMAHMELTELDQLIIEYALQMKTGEVDPSLEAAVHHALSDTTTTPTPSFSGEQEWSITPPPVEVCQTQDFPSKHYAPLQGDIQTSASSQEQCENIPVMVFQDGIWWNQQFVPMVNGEQSYWVLEGSESAVPAAAPPAAAAPPVIRSISKRKKQDNYVKKPPNAFMLFMREQRPLVHPALWRQGSGVVNAELGRRWKSLSEVEKEKYYQQAETESQLHYQQHPDWSAKANYGKRRRRDRRRKFPTIAEEFYPKDEEGTSLNKSEDVCDTGQMVMEASTTYEGYLRPCLPKICKMFDY